MKLKWKLSLSLLAVTGSLFLLGGYWMIHQNFMSSMDDAARRYTASHASQLDLVTTFLARQDDPSPSQAGAEAAAGVPDGALALADAGYALLFSNLPEELDKMDLYDAVEAADTGFVYRQHGDRIWFLEASALPAQTDLHLISAFEVTALYTERTEQLHRFWRISAVLLAAVALLTALVTGAVLRPLKRLQAAAQRIAGGVYSERTGFDRRDEVGALSREFDRMAGAVEARDQALRENIRQRDDFVSAFTHEVKTPMTAMLGYASMLRTRDVPLETRQKAADYIYHESKRLETLSRRLMALMRLGEEKLELEPTPLSGIFSDVRAAAAGLAGVRVLVPDSRGLYVQADRSLAETVLPFDMKKLRPFQAGYFLGFRAERRDREKEEFTQEIEQEIKQYTRESLQNSVSGYDHVDIRNHRETITGEKWNYAMLPVWMMTYPDPKSGQMYYFAMNGENGKVCGVLPVDSKKLVRLFLTIFIPVFVLLLLGGYLI